MNIKIKIEPSKEPEAVLNYFYQKCLDSYIIGEIESFSVEIEGTTLKKNHP